MHASKIQETLYFGGSRFSTTILDRNVRVAGPVSAWVLVGLMTVRILIVDDHPVVRQGLKTLLKERGGWDVIAEAADGLEAVEMADRLVPDVIVLDVSMPRMHGLDACRLIRQHLPSCEILIMTQHDSPQMMREAVRCGARGYVVKSNAPRDLLAAVDAVSQHRSFMTRSADSPEAH